MYLWAQSHTDSVHELNGWRKELESFESGMKESSQAEEKAWWIELERVHVRKPSREAPHPSWPELHSFTWNLLSICPFPWPQVVPPSFLYPVPSAVAEYTSSQCPVKMCLINEEKGLIYFESKNDRLGWQAVVAGEQEGHVSQAKAGLKVE